MGEIKRYKDLREVYYGELANLQHEKYPSHPISEHSKFKSQNGESLYDRDKMDALKEI